MLKSILCDYSDAYILFKATVTGAEANDANKKIIVKYCASFTDCISEINNTQVDNAEEIDVVMSMYNLIEYSDNYLRISGILQQYYTDEPALNNADGIIDFLDADNNSTSFKILIQN